MLLSFFIASAIFISTLVLIEMFIIFISAVLVWTAVLAFFMLRDWRLLLKILRWSISIWLVIFGIVVSEVLREGLIVNGSAPLHWDVRLAWTVWFIIVACSFVDWRFLVPAVALPLWFVSHPEVQTLLNYGLVRLKWIGIVHSPLAWATGETRMLELGIRTQTLADRWLDRVALPVPRTVTRLMGYTTNWVSWTTNRSLEKLRPSPPRWSWLHFVRY